MRKKFTKNKYVNTLSKQMIILFIYYSVDLYFSLAILKIKLNEIMRANPLGLRPHAFNLLQNLNNITHSLKNKSWLTTRALVYPSK